MIGRISGEGGGVNLTLVFVYFWPTLMTVVFALLLLFTMRPNVFSAVAPANGLVCLDVLLIVGTVLSELCQTVRELQQLLSDASRAAAI